jgi:hypothetical protein
LRPRPARPSGPWRRSPVRSGSNVITAINVESLEYFGGSGGDGVSDVHIQLTGSTGLTAADFVL